MACRHNCCTTAETSGTSSRHLRAKLEWVSLARFHLCLFLGVWFVMQISLANVNQLVLFTFEGDWALRCHQKPRCFLDIFSFFNEHHLRLELLQHLKGNILIDKQVLRQGKKYMYIITKLRACAGDFGQFVCCLHGGAVNSFFITLAQASIPLTIPSRCFCQSPGCFSIFGQRTHHQVHICPIHLNQTESVKTTSLSRLIKKRFCLLTLQI